MHLEKTGTLCVLWVTLYSTSFVIVKIWFKSYMEAVALVVRQTFWVQLVWL